MGVECTCTCVYKHVRNIKRRGQEPKYSLSNRAMTQSTQPRLGDNPVSVLERPSQSPERLWRDLNMVPIQPDRLRGSAEKNGKKILKFRCAKLVMSYPRRVKAVIAAKGASTKY